MAIATINPATGEHRADLRGARRGRGRATHRPRSERLRDAQVDDLRAARRVDARGRRPARRPRSPRRLTCSLSRWASRSRQSEAEVLKCAKNMRFYADNAEAFLADERLERSRLGQRIIGVDTHTSPWASYSRSCRGTTRSGRSSASRRPALMAGNTGLLKHASNVPQSALYLDTLFERAGFPAGSFTTLLIGSGEVAAVHRGLARQGRHSHRLGAGRPLGRRDRRRPGQEGRARARRLRPVHRHADCRPGRSVDDGGQGARLKQRSVVHRRQTLHRAHRRLRRVRSTVRREDERARGR